jgi:hypothetical protein
VNELPGAVGISRLSVYPRSGSPHPENSDVYEMATPMERGKFGMCGLLDTYVTR